METYGLWLWDLGVDGEETTRSVERAAALAFQLPPTSRVWGAIDPMGANTTEAALLRQLEHDMRLWMWAHTKDAKTNTNQPRPMQLRGEAALAEAKAEEAERTAASVASLLGLLDTEGGEGDG